MNIVTTVIATFNRREKICVAIESSFREFPNGPVLVVDDCSTDGTIEFLGREYKDDIGRGRLLLIRLKANHGVSAAKSIGYLYSNSKYVSFLDSDDSYTRGFGKIFRSIEKDLVRAPVIFFKCEDQNGNIVGEKFQFPFLIDLPLYLKKTSFGEALTMVNKDVCGQVRPYISFLRGYEGLGCMRLINRYGSAIISPVIARIYDTSGDDRLSVNLISRGRLRLILAGHLCVFSEFSREMNFLYRIKFLAKIIFYRMALIIKL